MANRSILWMGKSWENVLVCDYIFNRQRIYSSYRDLKFFTRCVKGYHLSVKDLRKGYLKAEIRGWTSERSLSAENFVEYPPCLSQACKL